MPEPIRKVGRGGAGNFYTQEDIESASQQHEDLEAQKLDGPDSESHNPSLLSTTSPTEPRRTGRGGAGNFVAASDLDENDTNGTSIIEKTRDAVVHTKAKVVEKLSTKPSGYGGRGGAGNWRPSAEDEAKERERTEEIRRSDVRDRAEQDVEAGLSRPPGAYLGGERQREK